MILVRHGRTSINASGVLAGRTPGIGLDDLGRTQAKQLGERLAALPYSRIVASPLQRCMETTGALVAARPGAVIVPDDRLIECGYGDWTGRSLKELAKERLWRGGQGAPAGRSLPRRG